LIRNVLLSRRWIRKDLTKRREELASKTHIASSVHEGNRTIKSWIVGQVNSGDSNKALEVK